MRSDDEKSRDELLAELHELRKSHCLFQEGESLAGLGSWEWDLERDTALFSRGWLILHGLDKPSMELQESFPIAHPDDRLGVLAALRDALDGAALFDIEYRIIKPSSGEIRFVHSRASVIRDPSGRPCKVYGATRDITERALAARDLRRANDFLEQLIESANALVVCLDNAGTILICNEAMERTSGYSRDELLGRSWFDMITPADRYPDVLQVFESMQTEAVYPLHYTNPILCKNGEERHISWRNSRFSGVDEGFFTVSFGQDITDQVNAVKALRDTRRHAELLSDFLENSSQPFLAMKPEGGIAIANKAFSRLLGYTRSELMEINWEAIQAGQENSQDGMDAIQRLRIAGKPVRVEMSLVRKNGAHVPVEVNLHQYVTPDGSVEYFYAFVSDITETKSSQDRLQAAMDAMEAASRAKSEFLANMSHEIRTPISAILGLAELSQRVPDPVKTARHLAMIADSAHNLLAIIGDVLDLSRIEAGKLHLESKPFSIRKLLGKALEPFLYACREKGIELVSDLDTGVPDELAGDSTRLGQVLTNLVGNALKFTDRGRISITVRELKDTLQGLAMLQFTVTDTGIGIASEHTATIFDSFRQADSSYSKAYQGAGLGLAICRELVSLMGGRIWVESIPGRGSTFVFTAAFELSGGATTQQAAGGSGEESAKKVFRILIAEDNHFNRHVFEQYLTMLGHEVLAVPDGQDALDCLRDNTFDLVLMDVQMPKLDGLEVIRRVRAGECGEKAAHTPVVALTAYAMQGDEQRFLAAGMTGYLSKPVTLEALQDAVTQYAGGGSRKTENSLMDGVKDVYRPMIDDFLRFIRGRTENARLSLEAGNFADACTAGHDIKGTSLAFGISPVNKAGEALEKACKAHDALAAARALRELDELLADLSRSSQGQR